MPPPRKLNKGEKLQWKTCALRQGQGEITHQLLPCLGLRNVESLPQETVLHKCLQHESFPQAAALLKLHGMKTFKNRLFQHESPWGQESCQQTCSSMAFSLQGALGLARSILHYGLPMGSQSPLGIHLLHHWILQRLQIDLCIWTSRGPRGTACFTMGFTMGWRGISAPAIGSHPPPPSEMTWVSAEQLLSWILTPLSGCCLLFTQYLFLLLNFDIPEVLPPSLMGSALVSGGSILALAGVGSVEHGEIFSQLLTEAAPAAPCPHQNLPIQTKCTK